MLPIVLLVNQTGIESIKTNNLALLARKIRSDTRALGHRLNPLITGNLNTYLLVGSFFVAKVN